jgi:hypothetical protein
MLVFFISSSLFATPTPVNAKNLEVKKSSVDPQTMILLKRYLKDYSNKKDLQALKQDTLNLKGEAIPALIKIMKSDRFPDKNRWVATFLLGRIIGKKSGDFILKFTEHPNWVLRMASLKTLLALGQKDKNYAKAYVKSLSDNSMIVRHQALENISRLNLQDYGANVWAMLYDKSNYQNNKNTQKSTSIIKTAIKTVGDLRFKKAEEPLLAMIQKKKYEDLFSEIDYSLTKISGKESPKGSEDVKKLFWKRIALSKATI